jgi:SAM-dependent MidA family methyltransferase
MCHRGHQADTDPLADVGDKDITAHVDFTGIALAGQDAGLEVLGYASQARFLLNCGLLDMLHGADLPAIGNAQKLVNEHEMGELFKVVGLAKGCNDAFMAAPLGFLAGDRMHTL